MTVERFAALVALVALAGCSKPSEPDPISTARSNLATTYTLSNGTMVPLTDYDCFGPARKAKNGVSYVECKAFVKGFSHAETHFCYTVRNGHCSESRPEE